MVLGKLPVPGRPTILITAGQGPIALAVGAGGGGGADIEILSQRAVKPKTTNQPTILPISSSVVSSRRPDLTSSSKDLLLPHLNSLPRI